MPAPSIFTLLSPYKVIIVWLVVLAVIANALTLALPKMIADSIDAYIKGSLNLHVFILQFGGFALGVFIFTYLQNIVQTYASERAARDLRLTLIEKISHQGYRFIEDRNPSKLLTNITSDIDAIKVCISQVVSSLVASSVIILGTSIILLSINWRLALVVLLIIPIIGGTFFVILRQVRALFAQSREVVDWLNKVISDSIIGAALIRVLNAAHEEQVKFNDANSRARSIGLSILQLFSFMIPIITLVSSLGTLMVMVMGGYYVVVGTMTLGSFAAFMSYIAILIFPILIIGFMSNLIAQATASYARVWEILNVEDEVDQGQVVQTLTGRIDLTNIALTYGEKVALKNISLSILPGTKVAILGPTAAGKTQLLNIATGLTVPTSGTVAYDGHLLGSLARGSFYPQIGLVFQDSVLFNTTVRENIAFSTTTTDEALKLAIETAELQDFIHTLPQGLDTTISERGSSLSGGQKQRIMLARALALNPKILFLDDFTARIDPNTEQKILANIATNYPTLTLISITQKIAPIEHYDWVVLLMEGEVLAQGTHAELMHTSPEYVQIYDSQRSTHTYEVRT